MAHGKNLDELIRSVQDRVKNGKTISLEEICSDCPEMLDALKNALSNTLTLCLPDPQALTGSPTNDQTIGYEPAGSESVRKQNTLAIPGYIIHGELGRGGMGIVYRASQAALRRTVAIKTLLNTSNLSGDQKERLQKEASALGMLQHPNIVQVFDVNEQNGQPYFVMELVEGISLDEVLAGRLLQPNDAATLTSTLAKAIQAAHAQGLVHRDIKPGNILLHGGNKPNRDEKVLPSSYFHGVVPKITDFGLAKKVDDAQEQARTQGIVGTPSYMSPEQAHPSMGKIGPASDTYSLGAMFYEMLVGKPPFMGGTSLETIRQVAFEEPVPPSRIRPGIPRDLETICLKCLEKKPEKRYATAGELAKDLDAYLSHMPISARPASVVERSYKWCVRNPARAIAGVFLALILVVIGVIKTRVDNERLRVNRENLGRLQESIGHQRVLVNDLTRAAVWMAASDDNETDKERKAANRLRFGGLMDGFVWIRAYVVHDQAVLGAEWSPDGVHYLTYGEDRSIRVHDSRAFPVTVDKPVTKAESKLGMAEYGGIRLARFFDEKRILFIDDSGSLYLWNWDKIDQSPKKISDGVQAFDIDASRKRLAIATEDGVFLDDKGMVDETIFKAKPVKLGGKAKQLIFSNADGRLLVRGERDLFTIQDGKLVRHEEVLAKLTCMAISPDGNYVATGNDNGRIQVWRKGETKPENKFIFSHPEPVICLAFSNDSKLLASGSSDNRANVRNLENGRLEYQILHEGDVTCMAFSSNPDWFITGSDDNTIRIWHAKTGRPASGTLVYNATLRTIVPHPRAPLMLAGGDDNVCCIWDMKPKNRVEVPFGEKVDKFLVAKNGMVFGQSGNMVKWASFTEIATAFRENGQSRFVDFSKTIRFDVISEKAQSISLWGGDDLLILETDGAVRHRKPNGEIMTILKTNPGHSHEQTIIGSRNGKYFVLETPSGYKRYNRMVFKANGDALALPHLENTRAMAFSKDDSSFAWGNNKGDLFVVNLAGQDYKVQEAKEWHKASIASMAFSPDGKKLATGGEDMFLKTWPEDPANWKDFPKQVVDGKLELVPHHASCISLICFNSDGTKIITGGEDNSLRVWNATTSKPLSESLLHNASVADVQMFLFRKSDIEIEIAATMSTEGAVYLWDINSGKILAPLLYCPGYYVLGYDFLPNAGEFPVITLCGALGTIISQRFQNAPEFASESQLQEFAEYHPAFEMQKNGNAKGTVLLPIAGSRIFQLKLELARMTKKSLRRTKFSRVP
ncbi:MAG: protein kinase domain-containing protein [Gemmataceae bacterium]